MAENGLVHVEKSLSRQISVLPISCCTDTEVFNLFGSDILYSLQRCTIPVNVIKKMYCQITESNRSYQETQL